MAILYIYTMWNSQATNSFYLYIFKWLMIEDCSTDAWLFLTLNYWYFGSDNSLLRECSVCYKTFSCNPGSCPLEANIIIHLVSLPLMITQHVSRYCQTFPQVAMLCVEIHHSAALSTGQSESREHIPGLNQYCYTYWDPMVEYYAFPWLKLRPNYLGILQSTGTIPTPFSAISVCHSLPKVLKIYSF
jgi:hypothetical protein